MSWFSFLNPTDSPQLPVQGSEEAGTTNQCLRLTKWNVCIRPENGGKAGGTGLPFHPCALLLPPNQLSIFRDRAGKGGQ